MTPPRRIFVALAVACMGAACNGAVRRESASVIEAVERCRHADEAARPAQEHALANLPCTVAAVCDAKRVCIDAIDATTRALSLKDEVTARLATVEKTPLDPSSPEAASLAQKLDEASHLLEAGRTNMATCERRLADLRVRYGP